MRTATKDKVKDDLYRRRHSLAHVLAQAVLQVRPKAQLGFGPPTDNGFYYDFLFDEPLTHDDLAEVETRMKAILKEKQGFEDRLVSIDEAIGNLTAQGATLKAEYAEELKNQGETELSFYVNGPFTDMCEGPHVENTIRIPANCFQLDTLAGAYWRGDERREQLTRIYGLAFESGKELKAYLEQRKLALERDHRKLGQELDLYTISEDVGVGLPLWLPNGTVIRDELEALAKETEFRAGYQRVSTPHITKANLYYTSGHLPHYQDDMFPPMQLPDEEPYYLKPMNCPHHHMIFDSRPRSYRDLPLRLSEYGQVYRYERSGALSGLLRVRGMSMNDAHIYCAPEQVEDEFAAVLEMHRYYYEMFRMTDFWMRLSVHGESSRDKYVDNAEAWVESEKSIRRVMDRMDVRYEEVSGEAAFYGPKVDFQIKNVVGREETASTNQLDFAVPPRFGLKYIGADGGEHTPYVIHRAPLGTHERFVSFLIEHFGGAFPTWMAPVQVRVLPISDEVMPFCDRIATELRDDLIRVDIDASGESFNKRLRTAITRKIPNMLIVGAREASDGKVTWRRYCVKNQTTMPFDTFRRIVSEMRAKRIMDNFADIELPSGE